MGEFGAVTFWAKAMVGVSCVTIFGSLALLISQCKFPERTEAEKAADKLQGALIRCENQTKSMLADASGFAPEPYGRWRAQTMAEDAITVQFSARVRNAFGGMVWAEFRCSATYDGEYWTAVVEQI